MHDLGSKPVHRILGLVSAFFQEKNPWDQEPGTWFGVEEIQKTLTGTRRVSHWVLLI